MSDMELLAREIYWAAYDQYIYDPRSPYVHPKGFTKEYAWESINETQRVFCLNQARRAMEFLGLDQ